MARLVSVLSLLLVAVQLGCGPAHTGTAVPKRTPTLPEGIEAQLTLPPKPATKSALATLRAHRSCQASWLLARYLVDLFDWVRLSPSSDDALAVLWTGCGLQGAPARGRLATDEVVEALSKQLKAAASACEASQGELARHARAGLEMIAADSASRSRVEDALQVVVAYRRIERSTSPLRLNASVRLADWCAKAFRLAAGGDPNRQHRRLNHCLFPLFIANPAPYFEGDPAIRPPDPPWTVLQEALAGAWGKLKSTRLAGLATRMKREDERFFSEGASRLPAPLRIRRFDLPKAPAGSMPWNRTPLILVGDKGYLVGGRAVLADDTDELEKAIAARLHNDGRRTVTVVVARSRLASRLLEVGRAARRAGALSMGLGVARRVKDRPTVGDVQETVFGSNPVLRLEELPVSLLLLASTSAAAVSRNLPRGMGYHPRTAEGQICALITRQGVQLSSRDGRSAAVPINELPDRLLELRRVYPGDRSIVVAPDRTTTVEDLAAVVAALRQRGGRSLFPGIGLANVSRIASPDTDLAPLVRLLATADVTMEPRFNRSWPDRARRCYLERLKKLVGKKKAPPQGTLILAPTGPGVRVVGGTLRDRTIRKCVPKSLGPGPMPGQIRRVTLTFALGANQR